MNKNGVFDSPWAPVLKSRRTKKREGRRALRRSNVHGSGINADEETGMTRHGRPLRKREFAEQGAGLALRHGQDFLGAGLFAGVRAARHEHGEVELRLDPIDERGKAAVFPAFEKPA